MAEKFQRLSRRHFIGVTGTFLAELELIGMPAKKKQAAKKKKGAATRGVQTRKRRSYKKRR